MSLTAIPRFAYFAQSGVITCTGFAGNNTATYILPISSANIEVSRPIEGVNTFGHFGSLNTAQTNLTTCKCTLKGYLGSGSGSLTTAGSNTAPIFTGLNTASITNMLGNTTSGNGIVIQISPGGWTMTGILDTFGLDIALGAFGMFDLGFAGVGEPVLTDPTGAGVASQTSIPGGTPFVTPITTMSVGAGPAGSGILSGCFPTSLKLSYNLPTDILGSLGDFPDAIQGSFYTQSGSPSSGQPMIISQMATKPPYKSSVTVEGYGIDPTVYDSQVAGLFYALGNIAFTLPHAKVSSRGISNAAGQVSQTFSYSIEDFSVNFTDIPLNIYSQQPSGSPSYGG